MKCFFKSIWPVMCCMLVLCCINNAKLSAQVWTDSLHIRIVNAKMQKIGLSDVALKFDVEVFRPNADWNQTAMKRDTSLGYADFYFGKGGLDLESVFGTPTVTSLSPLIGGASSALEMTHRYALGSFHIALRPVAGSKIFTLPYRKWMPVCQVSLPLKDPTAVQLGVVWDPVATACITRENSPIIKTLIGDVVSRPDSVLQIIDWTNKQSGKVITACEGSDLILAVKAFSTQVGTTFEWRDSIPGGSWYSLGKRGVPQSKAKHPVLKYEYELIGRGDTLVIYNAPASIDTSFFKCFVENLNMAPGDQLRSTGVMAVSLNDKLYAALTSQSNSDILIPGDSIFHCPGSDASIRVAFYNVSNKLEFAKEKTALIIGDIHVKYNYITAKGGMGADTLTFTPTAWNLTPAVPANVIYSNSNAANIITREDGKYWVDKVWSDSCVFGVAVSKYDTVIVKERANVDYDLSDLSVPIENQISLMDGVTFTFSNITTLKDAYGNEKYGYAIEDPVSTANPKAWIYSANDKVGTDTIHYQYSSGGCNLDVERLVHVTSNKYLTVNVLLEGPYNTTADTMYCLWKNYFPQTVTEYRSPYADSLTTVVAKPFPDYGKAVCDWIYVELWDYPPFGLSVGDSKRGVKVDSTSALLLSDGTVAGLDGKKYLTFKQVPADEYYVLIKHRNHLSVLSADKIKLSSVTPTGTDPVMLNLSRYLTNAFDKRPGVDNTSLFDNGKGRYLMYAGELNGDNQIGYADLSVIIKSKTKPAGYWVGDLNFDGSVNVNDQRVCTKNIGVTAKF